ncbi:hypothetical protein APASM_3600 [Actinosynnema pretiosum subsp. pretiosum]|nr:hypothetical protein APASM_3600 [Actinosynnema pretiosum subsp. pretiosum]
MVYSAELVEVGGGYELTVTDHGSGVVRTARIKESVVKRLPVLLEKLAAQHGATVR